MKKFAVLILSAFVISLCVGSLTFGSTPLLSVSLSSYPVSDTVVSGETVNFGSFALTAGSKDVLVTGITINGELDEDLDGDYNDSSTRWAKSDNRVHLDDVVTSVWIEDIDGTMIAAPVTFNTSGDAVFTSFSFDIAAGCTEVVRVYGIVNLSAPYNSNDDRVAVNILRASSSIVAQTPRGISIYVPGKFINGTEDNPTVYMNITDSGELSITENSADPLDDQIATAGTEDLLVGRYSLTATDEDFMVNTMTFTPTDASNTVGSASTRADNIESLTILYPTDLDYPDVLDGSSTAFMAGTNVLFGALSMMIPEDDTVTIELYADLTLHTNDGGGADSDDSFYFTINTGDQDGDTYGDIEAIGLTSGDTKTGQFYFHDVTASNATYVYRTIPEIANDPRLGSSLITGSDQELYRFTVTADTAYDAVLHYLSLDISSTGIVEEGRANSLSNRTTTTTTCEGTSSYFTAPLFIREYGGSSTVIGTGCYNPSTNIANFDLNTSNGTITSGIVVGAGLTKTFSVYADIFEDTDPTTLATLSTRIKEDTSHATMGTAYSLRGSSVGLIWSDYGFYAGRPTHGEHLVEWMNGYKVPGMPVSYVTLE